MLPFLIAGLTTGTVFGLAAVGLVLTYRTSGVLNFGHGALASASAFLFYFLNTQHGVPWPIAAAICVLVFAPLLGVGLEFLTHGLAGAAPTFAVLGTTGILLLIQGGLNVLYPPGQDRQVRQFLPASGFDVGGLGVAWYQVIIFAVGVVAVGGLTVFLRVHHLGLAMRSVVDSPELLGLAGTSPERVRRLAWVIGTMMASASGVVLAPLLPLDSTTMTFLVVTAFGAAAIGAFSSLPVTYLGGLAIGVGQALLQKEFVSSTGLVGGLSASLPFLILFTLLVAAPRLKPPSMNTVLQKTRIRQSSASWQARLAGAGLLLVFLALVPQFASTRILDWTRMVAYLVVFLSLGLLVRVSGQVSLAHVTFMAIGVAAFSHLMNDAHLPWLVALLVTALVAAPIGALLAVPAIRFPGVYLALASLGFGILVQQMFYSQGIMFGSLSPISIPRPHSGLLTLDSDNGYYYVVLAIAVVVSAGIVMLERSRLGRLLKAMSDSTTGLAASGASINVTRVLVFCLSTSIAAVAGVLDGGALGIVGGDGYQPLLSIQLFCVVLIVAGPTPWYAALAAAGMTVIPTYISTSVTVQYVFMMLFGVSAILVTAVPEERLFLLQPRLPAGLVRRLDRWSNSKAGQSPREPAPVDEAAQGTDQVRAEHGLLDIGKVTVRFGGLVAADQVELTAHPGRITGMIGPNGAGKSTVFNACTGLVRPASGTVCLGGRDLKRLGPPSRARRGLGRTFQQMELFDSLTVEQNIALGAEAAFAGWNPLSHIMTNRRQRRLVRQRTAEAMAQCGLTQFADEAVGTLSTGRRRLVELARCAAGAYSTLLLDEPSSGLDRVETQQMGRILRRLVQQRGIAVLLVEHDMALVNELCDYVHVLDFGEKIFEGTVAEVGASPLVRRAYLGEDSPIAVASTATTEG
ncbi:ATP-binding cassette domain-containing protein [Streptomyces sp. NPDC051985]|uniref:ABC transporter permease subunit n=1 Tax=Streptomyces sp. NPDC051985 TaxID=3155807 RepID=UPI00342A619B